MAVFFKNVRVSRCSCCVVGVLAVPRYCAVMSLIRFCDVVFSIYMYIRLSDDRQFKITTVDSKMHDKRIILFFIETGK